MSEEITMIENDTPAKVEENTSWWANAINLAMQVPGVKVDYEAFLRKELRGKVAQSVIDDAVKNGTLKAGVPKDLAETLAKNAINSKCVLSTTISFASGMPGGFVGLIGGSTVDVVQFFANFFNLAQRLMYIYGYMDISQLDSAQTDIMIAMLGAASGVEAAQVFVAKQLPMLADKIAAHLIAKDAAKNVFQKIANKVLTMIGKKGITLFTGKELGNMIVKSVPIIGGLISGALTLATFKPMAKELDKYLKQSYKQSQS